MQQDESSASEGYHYSPLPPSPIVSSAFAHRSVDSLTNSISLLLKESWTYLKILMLGL